MTSKPLVRRTLHTLRRAEFGFFGVVVYTRVQTPRLSGDPANAGTFVFSCLCVRPLRTNWLTVAIADLSLFKHQPPWCVGPSPCGERRRVPLPGWEKGTRKDATGRRQAGLS